MALYQLVVENPQYRALFQDILKWGSIFIIYCYLLMQLKMKYKNNGMMLCSFVVALMAYHLIICELIEIK